MAVDPKAIQPGSTAYGDRQTLEQGLAQLGGGGAPSGGGPPPSSTLPATGGSPIADLMSGAVKPKGNEPLTEGLSYGPGGGPTQAPGPLDNDLGNKLKLVASQSSSPTLRRLAQLQLRKMYKGSPNG